LQLSAYGSLVGHLLLRTLDRAERIHEAMCCRGFRGDIPSGTDRRLGWPDMAFITVWSFLFVVFRQGHWLHPIVTSVTGIAR
jgi:cobalt/nickel transport system permease protein